MSIGITEDEPNGREEVTLPRSIAADDDIVFGREGLNDRLVLVAGELKRLISSSLLTAIQCAWDDSPLKALDNNLLDIHLDRHTRKLKKLRRLQHHAGETARNKIQLPDRISQSDCCKEALGASRRTKC